MAQIKYRQTINNASFVTTQPRNCLQLSFLAFFNQINFLLKMERFITKKVASWPNEIQLLPLREKMFLQLLFNHLLQAVGIWSAATCSHLALRKMLWKRSLFEFEFNWQTMLFYSQLELQTGPYPTSISSAFHPLIPFLKILKLSPTLVASAKFPLTKTSSNPHLPFLRSSTLVILAPFVADVPVPTKLRMFSPTIALTVQVAERTSQFLEKASLSWSPFQRTLNDETLRGTPSLAAQSNLSLNLGPSLAAC